MAANRRSGWMSTLKKVLNMVANVRADYMRIEWGEMNVVASEIAMNHSCCVQKPERSFQ